MLQIKEIKFFDPTHIFVIKTTSQPEVMNNINSNLKEKNVFSVLYVTECHFSKKSPCELYENHVGHQKKNLQETFI